MQESLTFQDTEVGKIKIYYHKTPFYWDIEKVLASSKTSFGEKTIVILLVTCRMVIKLHH